VEVTHAGCADQCPDRGSDVTISRNDEDLLQPDGLRVTAPLGREMLCA
jgi:hypothetical protein